MPVALTLEESFPVPPAQVFAALTDLDQALQWLPHVRRIERLTEGALGPGSQFRETRHRFGQDASEVFEVTTFDAPRALGFVVDGRKGSAQRGEYRFSYALRGTDAGGTHMTLRTEIAGLGFWATLLGRLWKGPFQQALAQDHAALRAFLDRDAHRSVAAPF